MAEPPKIELSIITHESSRSEWRCCITCGTEIVIHGSGDSAAEALVNAAYEWRLHEIRRG